MPAAPATTETTRGYRLQAVGRREAYGPGDVVAGCRLLTDLSGRGRFFQACTDSGAAMLVEVLPASDPATAGRVAAARRIRELRHPHLEAVVDVRTEIGCALVLGRLCPGRSLAGWLAESEALPWHATLRTMHAVADGLRAAANAGLMHGDLHAGRIILGHAASGPKIYGLGETRAETSDVKPDGLAPERSCGAPPSVAADIYALGALAFRCIAGRAPFGPASLLAMAEAHAALRRPDVRMCVPDVPAAVAGWIQRAMAIDPRARPAGWDVVVLQLRSLIMAS